MYSSFRVWIVTSKKTEVDMPWGKHYSVELGFFVLSFYLGSAEMPLYKFKRDFDDLTHEDSLSFCYYSVHKYHFYCLDCEAKCFSGSFEA